MNVLAFSPEAGLDYDNLSFEATKTRPTFQEERSIWEGQSREVFFEQAQNLINEKLEEIIERKVQEKINVLLKERVTLSFREVSKSVAKKEITLFILKKQKSGIFKVTVLDLVIALKLPASQIEKIMEDFLKKGKIKEL